MAIRDAMVPGALSTGSLDQQLIDNPSIGKTPSKGKHSKSPFAKLLEASEGAAKDKSPKRLTQDPKSPHLPESGPQAQALPAAAESPLPTTAKGLSADVQAQLAKALDNPARLSQPQIGANKGTSESAPLSVSSEPLVADSDKTQAPARQKTQLVAGAGGKNTFRTGASMSAKQTSTPPQSDPAVEQASAREDKAALKLESKHSLESKKAKAPQEASAPEWNQAAVLPFSPSPTPGQLHETWQPSLGNHELASLRTPEHAGPATSSLKVERTHAEPLAGTKSQELSGKAHLLEIESAPDYQPPQDNPVLSSQQTPLEGARSADGFKAESSFQMTQALRDALSFADASKSASHERTAARPIPGQDQEHQAASARGQVADWASLRTVSVGDLDSGPAIASSFAKSSGSASLEKGDLSASTAQSSPLAASDFTPTRAFQSEQSAADSVSQRQELSPSTKDFAASLGEKVPLGTAQESRGAPVEFSPKAAEMAGQASRLIGAPVDSASQAFAAINRAASLSIQDPSEQGARNGAEPTISSRRTRAATRFSRVYGDVESGRVLGEGHGRGARIRETQAREKIAEQAEDKAEQRAEGRKQAEPQTSSFNSALSGAQAAAASGASQPATATPENWRPIDSPLTSDGALESALQLALNDVVESTSDGASGAQVHSKIQTPELGTVRLIVDRSEAGVQVQLLMENNEAVASVEVQRAALMQVLQGAGVSIASLQVGLGPMSGTGFAQGQKGSATNRASRVETGARESRAQATSQADGTRPVNVTG